MYSLACGAHSRQSLAGGREGVCVWGVGGVGGAKIVVLFGVNTACIYICSNSAHINECDLTCWTSYHCTKERDPVRMAIFCPPHPHPHPHTHRHTKRQFQGGSQAIPTMALAASQGQSAHPARFITDYGNAGLRRGE